MSKRWLTSAFTAAVLVGGPVAAQTVATVTTDVNVRSGPGNEHGVVGVVAAGDEVAVSGCIEQANWCEITGGTVTGWAYGDFLTVQVGGEAKPIQPNLSAAGVAILPAPGAAEEQSEAQAAEATAGVTDTDAADAAGDASEGAAGDATFSPAKPGPEIRTYIVANPRPPVRLDGEVELGAGIPENVELYEIPDQPDYRYVTINDLPVLVNPIDRRIVYIYR